MLTITKDFSFDASHRLNNDDWSPEKNLEVYGRCNNDHGHTYKLSVTLEGSIGESGMMINFTELKKIVTVAVLDMLDHRCLNDFYARPATCERMVVDIYNELKPLLTTDNYKLKRVDLYEQIYPTNAYASYEE